MDKLGWFRITDERGTYIIDRIFGKKETALKAAQKLDGQYPNWTHNVWNNNGDLLK